MFQDTPQYMFNSDFVQCKLLVLFENHDSFNYQLFNIIYNRVDHELQIFLIVFSILTKQKM